MVDQLGFEVRPSSIVSCINLIKDKRERERQNNMMNRTKPICLMQFIQEIEKIKESKKGIHLHRKDPPHDMMIDLIGQRDHLLNNVSMITHTHNSVIFL